MPALSRVLLIAGSVVPLVLVGAAVPVEAAPPVTRTITLPATGALGPDWKGLHAIGYGAAREKLGTSLGGDGEGIQFGPSYGTQTPDKSWWYLDVAKTRLAHYSSTGQYLGQVKVPKKFLTQGRYLQYQNPQALKNGSVVLSGTAIGAPRLLVMSRTHHFASVRLARWVSIHSNDGTYLYGFDAGTRTVRVDPASGTIKKVTWMRGQGRQRFTLSVGTNRVTVTRPGVKLTLKLVSARHPGKALHPQVELVMGKDGRLWILIDALIELSSTRTDEAVGLISVDRSGKVSAVQRVRTLSSASDPGDGFHLGIRNGASRPWLMFIDDDAARVYLSK